MKEYEFTLKFQLNNHNIDAEKLIDKLYESGCDDALIGIGKKGYMSLEFIREASSAYEAISSAIKQVVRAMPNSSFVEASPDFVGVTDVANILGCSRQNIQKLMAKCDRSCPPSVYGGSQSIWHLAEILTWLSEYKDYNIDESSLEVARATMSLNLANKYQAVDLQMQENFQALLTTK